MPTSSPPEERGSTALTTSSSSTYSKVKNSDNVDIRDYATSSPTSPPHPNAHITSTKQSAFSGHETSRNYEEGESAAIATQNSSNGLKRRPSTLSNITTSNSDSPFEAHDALNGSPSNLPSRSTKYNKEKSVRWRDLPRKSQLAMIVLARLSEPLTQTSLQAYMFYQIRSFDPSLQDSAIASQVGILQGCFTFAQFMTGIFWGRVSDSLWGGRKRVLLVGLLGTAISSIGFGFSRSFYSAIFWRTLGGVLNGNTGVIRTMVSEIVKEKKYQSRAFLLIPMCFNVGAFF